MRIWVPIALGLSVAACDAQPPQEETPIPVEPEGGIDDRAGASDGIEETLTNRIPTRFHGVWDSIHGTCARHSDLRLDISGSEIMFYESIGTVMAVNEEGDRTVLTLAMEGEGETWEDRYALTLEKDGQELNPQHVGGSVSYDPIPRKRCPQ